MATESIEKKSVLILGDNGLDRILIKCKNEIKSERLFSDENQAAPFREFLIPAGAVLLEYLMAIGIGDLCEPGKEEIQRLVDFLQENKKAKWTTFSSWTYKKPEEDETSIEGEFPKMSKEEKHLKKVHYYSCEASGGKYLGRSKPYYSVRLNEQDDNISENGEKRNNAINGDLQNEEVKAPKVVSIYCDMLDLVRNESPCTDWFDGLGSMPENVIVKTPLRYDDKTGEFIQAPVVEAFLSKYPEEDRNKAKGRITLLLDFDSLQYCGAPMRQSMCWEEAANEAIRCIHLFPDCTEYKAIVINFSSLGALIFEHKRPYHLCFFEGEIGDLISTNTKRHQGATFGVTTTIQAAITYAFATGKDLITGVEAGLTAARKLESVGYCLQVIEKTYDGKYPCSLIEPIDLRFPSRLVMKTIRSSLGEDAKKPAKKLSRADEWKSYEKPEKRTPSHIKIKDLVSDTKPGTVDSFLKMILSDKNLDPEISGNHMPIKRDKQGIIHFDPESFKRFDSSSRLFVLCSQIVRYGMVFDVSRSDDYKMAPPYLRLKNLLTFDRDEIRQTCSTYDALKTYINKPKEMTPVSICVFGAPGCGKSFTVSQLIEHRKEHDRVTKMELLKFNVSQMSEYKDLVRAFHQVRDKGLEGKLPIAFFDEFDTNHGTTGDGQLGWLRYFLAPMQDGEFLDENGVTHTIGRAVFVFAGGIYESMEKFRQLDKSGEEERKKKMNPEQLVSQEQETQTTQAQAKAQAKAKAKAKAKAQELKDLKVNDFVSRLKGYIDVKGPNKTHEKGVLHYFRRAALLRTCLEQEFDIGHNGYIGVTDNVILAFLKCGEFSHGVRSMKAIIQSSVFRQDEKVTASTINQGENLKLYLKDEETVSVFREIMWKMKNKVILPDTK